MPDCSLHLLALRNGIAVMAKGDSLWSSITVLDPGKPKEAFFAIAKLRALNCDASLNFFPSNTWQYNLLPLFCGIPKRYAFLYNAKRLASLSVLSNKRLPVDINLHDTFQCLALSGFFLNTNCASDKLVFPQQFPPADLLWAKEYMAGHSQKANVIAIHPGSSVEHGMDAKRWAPEKFGALADKVCDMLDAQAFIVGSADEADIKQATCETSKLNAHFVEPVSLQKTAALLSLCTLAICNDSGIMHSAACMGVPTAGIFGPTDEKRNGPIGGKSVVIRKEMQGFPLWTAANVGNRKLPGNINPKASLEALTVEDAWGIIKSWIEKTV
jgi:heptosyltransferase-2